MSVSLISKSRNWTMQFITVPARYAPEIEAALGAAVRSIEFDMKMRDLGGQQSSYVDTDESRTGDVVVLVGSSAAKQESKV